MIEGLLPVDWGYTGFVIAGAAGASPVIGTDGLCWEGMRSESKLWDRGSIGATRVED